MPFLNYDYFINSDAGEETCCRVCGAQTTFIPDTYGPTSFAASLAKKYSFHDVNICPNIESEWHKKALKLLREIESTSSSSLKSIMQKDLREILLKNK